MIADSALLCSMLHEVMNAMTHDDQIVYTVLKSNVCHSLATSAPLFYISKQGSLNLAG